MAKIGDVCASKIDTLNAAYNGKIDYIDISAVDNDKKKITNTETLQIKEAPSRARQLVECDDIIVSLVRPNLNAVAVVENSSENLQVASTGYCVLRCNQAVYSRYLFYFCQSETFINRMTAQATGASYPAVSNSIVKNCEIPLPERNKQKEIADILDKVTGLISLRKQQLAKLDELVKARFVEMFGDPVTNPKGYEKYKLENLARKISDGVHSKPDYTETGRPFLSVVNINKGVINFKNCKYVSEDAYQKMIKSTHPERGDVLYTKVGATYGIPAYVDTDIAFCLYVSVCLIKPKREVINPRFLSLSMEMPYVKHQADRRIKGIGVPDLHLNQISEFEILCPPLKEQDIFIYFVERLDGEKRVVQQSLEKLELMKKALMQEYFG